jgi:type IV secretory pathway TrbD component
MNLAANLDLSQRQFLISVLMGIILWFVAAMVLRFMGPLGIYDGIARIILYVAIIPGTLPFVFLFQKVAGLTRQTLAIGFSVGTAAAIVCDGLALAWYPQLYGATVELHAGAGGTILWGGGVGLFLAFAMARAD